MPEKETKPDAYSTAVQFVTEKYTRDPESQIARECLLGWWRGEWCAYTAGRFVRMDRDELKAHIVGFLREHAILVTPYFVNAIVLALTHLCMIPSGQETNRWMRGINGALVIPAANGNVSLSDRDENRKPMLLSHTALFFSFSVLPYDYDVNAKCPLWLTFLDDVLLGRQEYIHLLQEYFGYLLSPDCRQQRFLVCTGPGANGKGVVWEIGEAMVGSDSCSHVPLAQFGDRFALYATLGKRLNVTSESMHMIAEEGETALKAFAAGDTMSFERKYGDRVEMKPTAKIVICTNALPRFSDKTWGVWRRLLLLPFDKTVDETAQIKDLADELKKELPGVLNWAIDGLDRLNLNGRFTVPESHAQMLEDYRRDADPARAFLCDRYEPSTNGEYVFTDILYADYKEWCQNNGYKPLGERLLGKQVHQLFPSVDHKRFGSRTDRRYVYTGLTDLEKCPVSSVPNVNPTLS